MNNKLHTVSGYLGNHRLYFPGEYNGKSTGYYAAVTVFGEDAKKLAMLLMEAVKDGCRKWGCIPEKIKLPIKDADWRTLNGKTSFTIKINARQRPAVDRQGYNLYSYEIYTVKAYFHLFPYRHGMDFGIGTNLHMLEVLEFEGVKF